MPYSDPAPGDSPLVLDAYLPRPAGTPRPAVVMIHGGAWRGGTRADVLVESQIMAQQGYVAFAVDYRRTADRPFPAAVDDIAAAVRWVRDNADEYGVDAGRVSLVGLSAGGNLAALVGTDTRAQDAAGGPPAAVVSLSGPMDLRTMATNDNPRAGCTPGAAGQVGTCAIPELIVDQMPLWIGCPIDATVRWAAPTPRPAPCPDVYTAGSPVTHVSEGDAPMLLVTSASDPVVSAGTGPRNGRGPRRRRGRASAAGRPGEGHAHQLFAAALVPALTFLAAH